MNQSPETLRAEATANTKETLSNPAEASETLSDADLAYIARQAEKAQESVDELMQRTGLSDMEKSSHLEGKISRYEESIAEMEQAEKDELAKTESDFAKLAEIQPLIYSPEELAKTQRETQDQYRRRLILTQQTLALLREAKEKIEGEKNAETENPKTEETETATPEEPNKEETPEKQKPTLTVEMVDKKRFENEKLAEELKNLTHRLNRIATDISPKELWWKPLGSFNEDYVNRLRARLGNITTDNDELRGIALGVEQGNPQAESRYKDVSDQLDNEWRDVEDTSKEGLNFIGRLRRQTEELHQNSLNSDHPIYQSGSTLQRMVETVSARQKEYKL